MAAATLSQYGYTKAGSKTVVETHEKGKVEQLTATPVSSSVSSLQLTVVPSLPTPPLILAATASVTADAPGRTMVSSVAQVRDSQSGASTGATTLVVDFQAARTVSALAGPGNIQAIQSWLGTRFDDNLLATSSSGTMGVSFPEVLTERLLVTLADATTPEAFAQAGTVVISTSPADLELLVGDARAWSRPGPSVGADGKPFSATVDLTAPVAAAASAGRLPVVLALRASAPGQLSLTGNVNLLQRYPVAFPEGAVRMIDASTEGVYPLSLPITATGAVEEWQIQRVVLDVSAKLPATRVLPPDGPERYEDAELSLDPDHGFVVRLPPGTLSQLAEITGVRLLVSPSADGAELAGILRGGSDSTPGDPLPKTALGPAMIAPPTATAATAPDWIDLNLAAPHKLTAGEPLWLELQAARGRVTWSLATPQTPQLDAGPLLRRTPSGAYAKLSTLVGGPSCPAALRVTGQAEANNPLPAVAVNVAGNATDTVAGVPAPAGTTLVLGLSTPAKVASSGGAVRELKLELTISTPGSYAISSPELQYTSEG